jgi:hypothetical protein
VHPVIRENRHLTVREVSEKAAICNSSCHVTLTEKLKTHHVATKFGSRLLTESMNFWRSMRLVSYPSCPTLQIGPSRLSLIPKVEIHPKRLSISDGTGDKRKFAKRPSRYPTKHVPGHIPELEKMQGVVYQQ